MFRKRNPLENVTWPGTPDAADGMTAILEVEAGIARVTAAHPRWLEAGPAAMPFGTWLPSRTAEDGETLSGVAAGAAAAGVRASVFSSGRALSEMRDSLSASVTHRLPYVVHHLVAPASGRPGSGGWPEAAGTGAFVLAPYNVQAAADFALIAHRLAEAALLPGVCLIDEVFCGMSVQSVRLPEAGLAADFLGSERDQIDAGTDAQRLMLGPKRRRVPALLDLARPIGSGLRYPGDLAPDVAAARDVFFHRDVAPLADAVMDAFAGLTARRYARAVGFRDEDADYLVLASGGIVEELEAMVEHLRRHTRARVGVVNVAMLRPFPGALISHMLKGKKGVTVLDAPDSPLAEEGRLTAEVRSAVDRAAENGLQKKDELLHEGYAAYVRPADRPRLYSAFYVAGDGRPTGADLQALFENMMPGGPQRTRFHLGVRFSRPEVRIPAVERRQQALRNAWPDLESSALAGRTGAAVPPAGSGTLEIRSGGRWTGRLIARALFHGAGWRIRTVQAETGACRVAHSPTGLPPELFGLPAGCLILTGERALHDRDVIEAAADGAIVLIDSDRQPEKLWRRLPRAIRRGIRKRNLRLLIADAGRPGREATEDVAAVPWLAEQVLIGGWLQHYPHFDSATREQVAGRYRADLERLLRPRPDVAAAAAEMLRQGMDAFREVEWTKISVDDAPLPERDAPRIVREAGRRDESIFDVAHAWETTGYLIESDRRSEVLPDPALAAGTAPAGSSAFHSRWDEHGMLPALAAENCTACGSCWAWCPESAIRPSVQEVSALIGTAIDVSKRREAAFVQLPRVLSHLSKRAHRVFADDGLHRFLTLGALLDDAFAWVLEKMKPSDEQREALEREFALVRNVAAEWPLVNTETFFEKPEAEAGGSGLVFSLAVDPEACTSCGLCASACTESALEMAAPPPAGLQAARENAGFYRELPEVSIEQLDDLVPDGDARGSALALLNRRAADSVSGGGEGAAGSGARTCLRLFAAAVEAHTQPHMPALQTTIDELIRRTRDRLQSEINGVVHVADFERLGRRLHETTGKRLEARDLAELIDSADPEVAEIRTMRRLSERLDELNRLKKNFAPEAGGGPAASVAFLGTGSALRGHHTFPYNPYSFPWMHHLDGDAASLAEGAFEGVAELFSDAYRTIRLARLELDGTYQPEEHDGILESFSWSNLSDEERSACPPLVVITNRYNDRVERLLRSGLPYRVVLINARRYMHGDAAAGRDEPGLAALAAGSCFVLQATPSDPEHLMSGIRDGLAFPGPALFHLYAPEADAEGIAAHEVADQALRAVQSRVCPLFTFDPRRGSELHERLSLERNPDPEHDFARRAAQVVLPNGLVREEARPVTFGDWAVRQGRFDSWFRFVPRKDWHDAMIPLAEYIALPREQRDGREPYVVLPGGDGRDIRKAVSDRVVRETEDCLAVWHLLLEVGGLRSRLADRLRAEARAAMEVEMRERTAELEAGLEERFAEQERTHAERYHATLKEQLLALSGFRPGSDRGEAALRELLASYASGAEERS